MRYTTFRDTIERTLRQHPDGLTWAQLRERYRLPYDRPCPTWIKQLERDMGLVRVKGSGRALVWKVVEY
jgi:hypothetical protein